MTSNAAAATSVSALATNSITIPGAGNYIDQVIAAQGFTTLQNIFNTREGITFATLKKLVMYLSIDAIKQLVQMGVSWIKNNFSAEMLYTSSIFQWLTGLLVKLRRLGRSRQSQQSQQLPQSVDNLDNLSPIAPPSKTYIDVELSKLFWNCVLEDFATNPADYSRTITDYSFVQETKTRMSLFETWSNIQIRFDAVSKVDEKGQGESKESKESKDRCVASPRFDIKFTYDYNTVTKDRILKNVEVKKNGTTGIRSKLAVTSDGKLDTSKYNSCFDMVPFPDYVKYITALMQKHGQTCDGKCHCYWVFPARGAKWSLETMKHHVQESSFLKKRLYEVMLIWYTAYPSLKKSEMAKATNLFDHKLNTSSDGFSGTETVSLSKFMKGQFDPILHEIPYFDNVSVWLRDRMEGRVSWASVEQTTAGNMLLSTTSDLHTNNEDLVEAWTNYLQRISQVVTAPAATTSSNTRKKVKLYSLRVKRTEIETKVDNPEYESWEATMKYLTAAQQSSVTATTTTAAVSANAKSSAASASGFSSENELGRPAAINPLASAGPAPPKTLTKKTTEVSILCEEENEGYKDFSTLYLDTKDHHRLYTCLDQFKNNQPQYDELGIPYKLGIIMHGEAGGGKSASVLTIGSFLQKNIYNIDLREVKTNGDLKKLFTHVNKQCANGGVIVMEDIDVMCSVVHRRDSAEAKAAFLDAQVLAAEDRSEDAPLTLSYFLNLLQGSLTQDGSVFIATTNDYSILDPAFVRAGRVDVTLELRRCTHHQIKLMYKRIIGREMDPTLLATLPEYKILPAEMIATLVEYRLRPEEDIVEAVKALCRVPCLAAAPQRPLGQF